MPLLWMKDAFLLFVFVVLVGRFEVVGVFVARRFGGRRVRVRVRVRGSWR